MKIEKCTYQEYELTSDDIIGFIESKLTRVDIHNRRENIKLYPHQKTIIRELFDNTGRVVVNQARQLGITSLYVWIAIAINTLNPEINSIIFVQNHRQVSYIKAIVGTAVNWDVKIDVGILPDIHAKSKVAESNFDIYMFDLVAKSNWIQTIIGTFNSMSDVHYCVSINHAQPAVYNFWVKALLREHKMQALFFPYYVIRHLPQWQNTVKLMYSYLGAYAFYKEYLCHDFDCVYDNLRS